MKTRRLSLLLRCLYLLFLLNSIPVRALDLVPKPGEQIAIVAHPGVPVDELSLAEVRKIFLADRQYWTPKLRITLLICAPHTWERKAFFQIVYRMDEAQFRQYWIRKEFRDQITSFPRTVYSAQAAASLAARLPGAITFLDAAEIPSGVKVLKVLSTKDSFSLRH